MQRTRLVVGGSMRRVCVLLAAAALVAAGSSHLRADRSPQASTPSARPAAPPPVRASSQTTPSQASAQIDQRQLVEKYCVTCHSDRARTGGLTLEGLDPQNTSAHAEVWEK